MNPYLGFTNGGCKAAFAHYQAVLGAKCVFISTWAESPMADQAPGGDGSRIMQATLQFPDGSILMGAAVSRCRCRRVTWRKPRRCLPGSAKAGL